MKYRGAAQTIAVCAVMTALLIAVQYALGFVLSYVRLQPTAVIQLCLDAREVGQKQRNTCVFKPF